MRALKIINRVLSVAIGLGVWSWVHAHDNASFYNNAQGTDAVALLAGLIAGGLCWIVSNKTFEKEGY